MTRNTALKAAGEIGPQMPEITNECLHFFLEAHRADRGDRATNQAKDGRALLRRIKTLRKRLDRVPVSANGGHSDEIGALDFALSDLERDLEASLPRLAPPRRSRRRTARR